MHIIKSFTYEDCSNECAYACFKCTYITLYRTNLYAYIFRIYRNACINPQANMFVNDHARRHTKLHITTIYMLYRMTLCMCATYK